MAPVALWLSRFDHQGHPSSVIISGGHFFKGITVLNFYPHHISDFNNSTRHLTRVERSVYRDAIELYYDTESVLTDDIERLQKRLLCRSDEEKQALSDVLDEFFYHQDDGYFHERCDHEIAKYRANISAKAKAGIASAEARRKKAKARKQNSTRVKSSSTSVHNQEPITNNQEPITNNQSKDISHPSDAVDKVKVIFDYWCLTMSKSSQTKLTVERRKCINARLKDGYTVDQIKQAIDGCANSSFHMGKNDNKTIYNDLTLICRNGSKLEGLAQNIGQGDKSKQQEVDDWVNGKDQGFVIDGEHTHVE